MRLHAFGRLTVGFDNGRTEALATRPGTVLALLAARHGRLVRDDELIEAIWPAGPPKSARTALQGYVLTVRDLLDPNRDQGETGDHVVRDRTGYRLVVTDDELDLAEFDRLARQARPWPDATLERLIELTASPPLQEFQDASWASEVRAIVAETRLECLVEYFELELQLNDGAALLSELRAAHGEFPFDERLARLLMLALYRNGRQQDALEVYAALRVRLRDDLGVSPNPQLEALYVDVLNHAPGLLLHAEIGMNSANATRPTHPSGLLGRDDDIAVITNALLADRTVTIVGPGGVGKSSVMSEVVESVREKFVRNVGLDLANVPAGGVSDAIAQALGIEVSVTTSLGVVVADVIAAAPTLVVLDTCEVAADSLAPILDEVFEAPGIHVLLASRTPVGHGSERQYRLEPLALDDAVALLGRSSIRQQGLETADLADLARRLDGLPLALDMVAGKLAAIGPRAVLDGIDAWIADPRHDSASAERGPERHQSVQALVEWSLGLVDPEQAVLLPRIAAITGDFPLEALTDLPPVEGVPSERVADVVGSLVDDSLIVRIDDVPTFRMLDTVAAVVIARRAEDVQAQRDVLANHVTLAAWGDYTGTGPSTVDTWVPTQFARCLEHLDKTPDARGVMLATAAARTWLDRGVIQHGRSVLERALDHATDLSKPLASIAWTVLGFNQTYQGDLSSAIRSYRRAAETADTVPFPGVVELVGATLAWLECDFERSWELASSAVDVMTAPTRRAPANLIAFAKSAVYAGDLVGAADCYERARRLAGELDDPIADANALRLAAVVRSLEGDHDVAWRWAHQSLVLHDPVRSPLGAAQASSSMALIAMLSGDEASADNWSRIAVERVRRQFDVQTVSVTVPVIAVQSLRAGRVQHAARLVGWLDAFIDELRHVHHPTTNTLMSEVREALAAEDSSAARSWSARGAAMGLPEMLQFATS